MSNAPLSKNPPLCQGPDPQPRKPRQAIPAGAIDCHCHVFEDQTKYPLTPQRSYTPQLCTLADYLPYFVLPLYASVEKIDWRLGEAAMDLGAGRIGVFFHAVLPQILPALA